MTTDIKLLPLPEWQGDFMTESEFREAAEDYALACVAHATAAKDAEIAGWKLAEKSEYDLRMEAEAEIEALRALMGGVEVQRDANWQAYTAEKARAERLAEALREARNRIQRLALECPHGSDIRHDACEWADEASAALRDHDQEGKDG